MAHPKIMAHPDKSTIVRMLARGDGVRKVARWLKEKYPGDKTRQLDYHTIQNFRKDHMKIEGDVLKDIQKERGKQLVALKTKAEHREIRQGASYKEKLAEVVDTHLDIKRSLLGLHALIEERIQHFFDMAQRGEAAREDEKLLQGHFDRYIAILEKWAKWVDKLADQRVEHNINLTVVNEQMSMLRTAVSNVLGRMDPELAVAFITELDREVGDLSYRHDPGPSLSSLAKESRAMLAEEIDS